MPGPGTARDRTARKTAVQVQSSVVRLSDGLDGWRRHIVRQRSAAVARRWLLITLGTALAGVMAGRIDGSPLLTAAAASSIALAAGAVKVIRSRKISRDDAARLLDATFGLDEQVGTALYFADDRTADQSPLVASLIERAADLVSVASGEAVPRAAPAYREWAVMAVTAASVAAVAAVPGTVPGPHRVAGGSNAADEVRTAQRGRPAFGASATASDPMRTGRAAVPASGTASPAAGRVARSPDARPTSPPPSGSAAPGRAGATGGPGKRPAGPSPSGRPSLGGSPSPSDGSSGGSTDSPGSGPADLGGPVSLGRPSAATGRTAAAAGGNSAASGGTSAPTSSPSTPTSRASATGQPPATPATGPGQIATEQHKAGTPGGDTAGSQPGDDRTGNGPAQLLPLAGDRVLLIVLPGGNGLPTTRARANPDTPGQGQQAEGNGGTASATTTPGPGTGSGVTYVPPDDNEVPFGDQSLLGRYF